MKFRVLELALYNGRSIYLCQRKKFLLWKTFRTVSNMPEARECVETEWNIWNTRQGERIKKKIVRWHSDNV